MTLLWIFLTYILLGVLSLLSLFFGIVYLTKRKPKAIFKQLLVDPEFKAVAMTSIAIWFFIIFLLFVTRDDLDGKTPYSQLRESIKERNKKHKKSMSRLEKIRAVRKYREDNPTSIEDIIENLNREIAK